LDGDQSNIDNWPNIGEKGFENIGIGFKKCYRSVSRVQISFWTNKYRLEVVHLQDFRISGLFLNFSVNLVFVPIKHQAKHLSRDNYPNS